MMVVTITLLVALSLLCVYCYDKNHRIKERNLILKKYLKKSRNKSENELHNQ